MSWVVPPVIGFLLGWFVRSLIGGELVPNGHVLTAAAALTAAWWIQRAVRRQNELDRVPIESVGRLCQRLETMISECVDLGQCGSPTDGELVQKLRLVSNEIGWLGSIINALSAGRPEHQRLFEQYVLFKRRLTEGPSCDIVAASNLASAMRISCLKIQWQLSRRILDRPGDLGTLTDQ